MMLGQHGRASPRFLGKERWQGGCGQQLHCEWVAEALFVLLLLLL